jgi:uncharacterized protein
MLVRTLYALRQGWHHRHALATLAHTTPVQQNTLSQKPVDIRDQGIKVVILDFDGVLAPHGEAHVTAALESWLDACVTEFGAAQIFILSNKPLPVRLAYFAQRYPGVRCISACAKKPYPAGLYAIHQLTGQAPEAHVLLDDRLLTGALAAYIAGSRIIYIKNPLRNFAQRPITETFFQCLRLSERALLSLFIRTVP